MISDYETFHKHLAYDPETGILKRKTGIRAGCIQNSKDNRGYIIAFVAGKSYRAHRLIWVMHHGQPAPALIDHINGNTSDNRIVNLRPATPSQNTSNRHKNPPKKSGLPKGVWSMGRTFRAAIYVNSKLIMSEDSYQTPEEAGAAYNEMALRHHGEFAQLNKAHGIGGTP